MQISKSHRPESRVSKIGGNWGSVVDFADFVQPSLKSLYVCFKAAEKADAFSIRLPFAAHGDFGVGPRVPPCTLPTVPVGFQDHRDT